MGLGLVAALHLGEELNLAQPSPGIHGMAALVVFSTFAWLLARNWRFARTAPHLVAAGLVLCAAEMGVHEGDGLDASIAWFALAPLVAGSLGSLRSGLTWTALSLAAWGTTAWLQQQGMLWQAPPLQSSGLLAWTVRVLPIAAAMMLLWGQGLRLKALRTSLADAEQRAARDARELRGTAQHLRDEQKLRGGLLDSLDHGHRTPLSGMLGITGLLLQTRLDAEQRRMVEDLRLAATTLRAGVDRLGDLARLAGGDLQFEHKTFDLHEVLADATQPWNERAAARGSEIVVQLHQGTPRFLSGDPERIRRVLDGLVSRAVECTDDGEIVVEVAPMAVAKGRAGLRFLVEDGSQVMSPETQAEVLDALMQRSTAEALDGLEGSASLALCRALADAMEGETGFRAAGEGRGTRLWVTLPLPAAADGRGQGLFAADFEGLRALVVHGSERPRRAIVEQLRAIGMSAVEADSCPEALNMLELASDGLRPFDLALVDETSLRIPLADLRERLLERPQLAGTCLVLLTACGAPEECQRFLDAGVPAYLTKPVLPSALKDTIALAVGLRPQAAEDAA